MNILLIEPDFPKTSKSKNHNNFMPIGLLKLASFYRKKGHAICLIRGNIEKEKIFFEYSNGRVSKNTKPDQILITSYFTYWSIYVKKAVKYYRNVFPKSKIIVGGIYASLMPEHCKKFTGCDEVYVGIHKEAEQCSPAYNYLEKYFALNKYQIIHTSRGCIRHCDFCGVYKIEPEFTYKSTILKEIKKEKLIFYDNNLLANPNIESILKELVHLKASGIIKSCEAQSGIDGRLLEKDPNLALLLKDSGFNDIRISWDGPLSDANRIKKQIQILKKVGYNLRKDIFVFMIYNWDIPFEEMEKKRLKCWEWKVQISDCRYRPLNQVFDRYKGQKFRNGQTSRDYYIHKKANWTDQKIRAFRKHIRRQNMCIRMNIQFYTNSIERSFLNKYATKELINIARYYPKDNLEPILNSLKIPYWFPENYDSNGHCVSEEAIYKDFEQETNKKAIIKGKESSALKIWRNKIQRKVLIPLIKKI